MASGGVGGKGGGMSESGAGLPALLLFTNAVQTKFRGMRYAIEDRWESAVAKKAVKATEYVVKPGDNLLDIAEKCVSKRTSLPAPRPLGTLTTLFLITKPNARRTRHSWLPFRIPFSTHTRTPPFKNFPVIA